MGRIKTTNSDYWRLHCPFQRHAKGMAMVIKVGTAPEVPENFPQCENFAFKNDDDFQRYLDRNANRKLVKSKKKSKGKVKSHKKTSVKRYKK